MKLLSPRIAFASAAATLGLMPLAQANHYEYNPLFVAGVNELERSTKTFHADYLTFLKQSRRAPVSGCSYRALLDQAGMTAGLSSQLADQVRRGTAPCQVETQARKLSASMRRVEDLSRTVTLTPCLLSALGETRKLHAAVDQRFGRELLAYNQSLRDPRYGAGPGAAWPAGYPSRGYGQSAPCRVAAPKATRPANGFPPVWNNREQLISMLSDRVTIRR